MTKPKITDRVRSTLQRNVDLANPDTTALSYDTKSVGRDNSLAKSDTKSSVWETSIAITIDSLEGTLTKGPRVNTITMDNISDNDAILATVLQHEEEEFLRLSDNSTLRQTPSLRMVEQLSSEIIGMIATYGPPKDNSAIFRDAQLVGVLKQIEEEEDTEKEQRTKRDAMLAMKIHRHEMAKVQKYSKEILQGMTSTPTGKSLLFVQHVLSLHCRLEASAPKNLDITSKVDVMAKDGMVPLTERLLQLQAVFKASGKDATVDIGYHYTKSSCLGQIRTNGLMNATGQKANNVIPNLRGSRFGEGIYTANYPFKFKYCGEVGVLVARLKGHTLQWSRGTRVMDQADTVLGNKENSDYSGYDHLGMYDEIVLRNSAQCIPLMQYCSSLIKSDDNCWVGNEVVHLYHCELQAVIDKTFNDGEETLVQRIFPQMQLLPKYKPLTKFSP